MHEDDINKTESNENSLDQNTIAADTGLADNNIANTKSEDAVGQPEPSDAGLAVSNEVPPAKRSLADLIYGVLAKPADTFRYTANVKPWITGFVLYILISWVTAIAGVFGQRGQLEELSQLEGIPAFDFDSALVLFVVVATPFTAAIGFAIMSGIYHLIAKLFKGQGEYQGLIASLGFASIPNIFSVPFVLLGLLGGTIATIIASLISFAFSVWVMVLDIIAIKENYKFSTARALATFFLPIIAMFILLIVIVLIIVISLIAVFSDK